MPSATELVAAGRTDDEVARLIGADAVVYQDLADLVASCRQLNPKIQRFDTSVFDGIYVTGNVTPDYLRRLDERRRMRSAASGDPSQRLDIYNAAVVHK